MTAKLGIVSLGCPKNLVDSEIMLGILKKDGFEIVGREQDADVLVVNTCAFINDAKKESIKTIFEMAKHKADGKCRVLLVAGCLAQRYHKELLGEMPEIDGLIGTGSIPEIAGAVRRALAGEKVSHISAPGYLNTADTPRVRATPAHTAYLKIAEGCNNCCSYCIIPQVRGSYRSRKMEDILAEAAWLTRRGVKELILVAQDTTCYGMDLYGRPVLSDLLERIAALESVVWVRLLYAYPTRITDNLIQLMAVEKKICRYLDIPIQHCSGALLKRMNRHGSRKDLEGLVKKLRSVVPGVTIRTSFIVGLPGETEEDFQELLDFMSRMKFDRVGVFAYSREEGTAAATMTGQVPGEIKLERRNMAMELQQKISLDLNREKIGKKIAVLVEGSKRHRLYTGRSEGDAPDIDGSVLIRSDVDLRPGDMIETLVEGAGAYDLTGVPVS